MARLTTTQRKKIPASQYGLPRKAKKGPNGGAPRGAYPMPDKAHARSAKSYASKEQRAGKLSASAEAEIDAKADRVLGKRRPGAKAAAKPKRVPKTAAKAAPKRQRDSDGDYDAMPKKGRARNDGLRAYAMELNRRMH